MDLQGSRWGYARELGAAAAIVLAAIAWRFSAGAAADAKAPPQRPAGQAPAAAPPPGQQPVALVNGTEITRDRLVAAGITINGLTILNEWPTLDSYFESNVAGGPGHFVVPAADYGAYGEAILRKLLREIVGPSVT